MNWCYEIIRIILALIAGFFGGYIQLLIEKWKKEKLSKIAYSKINAEKNRILAYLTDYGKLIPNCRKEIKDIVYKLCEDVHNTGDKDLIIQLNYLLTIEDDGIFQDQLIIFLRLIGWKPKS